MPSAISATGKGVPARNGGNPRRYLSLCYLSRRTGYPHVNSALAEDSVSVNRSSLVQPVGRRPVMSTGVGIALVAAGAILRFAVPATFIGLNLRAAGVIVMLTGVIALLPSLLVWGSLSRRDAGALRAVGRGGPFLVRAVHHETRGLAVVSGPP
jgi:hypothetical protein